MEYFEILAKIYNTLLLISTKGENTIYMGQCIVALKEVLSKMQNDMNISENKEE